jgi:hypothetical protein
MSDWQEAADHDLLKATLISLLRNLECHPERFYTH